VLQPSSVITFSESLQAFLFIVRMHNSAPKHGQNSVQMVTISFPFYGEDHTVFKYIALRHSFLMATRHTASKFNKSLQSVTQNTLHHCTISRRYCRSHRWSPCSAKTSKQIALRCSSSVKTPHKAPKFNKSLQSVTQNTFHHCTVTRRHCRSQRWSPCSAKTSKQIALRCSSSVKTRHTAPKFNKSLQSVAQNTFHHCTIAWHHCTSRRD
jgi:hypothetical protein